MADQPERRPDLLRGTDQPDQFEFITTNLFSGSDLTTFAGQAACAAEAGQSGKGGFNLPAGGGTNASAKLDTDCLGNPTIYGHNVGTIEIKAAWTALPSDHSLDYRYKTAIADISRIRMAASPRRPWGWSACTSCTRCRAPRNSSGRLSNRSTIIPTMPAPATLRRYCRPIPNQKPGPGYTYFNPGCTATTDRSICASTINCPARLAMRKASPRAATPTRRPCRSPGWCRPNSQRLHGDRLCLEPVSGRFGVQLLPADQRAMAQQPDPGETAERHTAGESTSRRPANRASSPTPRWRPSSKTKMPAWTATNSHRSPRRRT